MTFRYGPLARALHWITAALIVVIAILGVWIAYFRPEDEAFKFALYNWHESFGITVLLLTLIRLANRAKHPPAPLPDDMRPELRFVAQANHTLLYAVLIVQPVIGFLATNAWGFPLKLYNVIQIPSPIGRQPDAIAMQFTSAHAVVAILLLVLLAAHIAGVIYHAAIRKDGLHRRMI
jgi:cytochrome b561